MDGKRKIFVKITEDLIGICKDKYIYQTRNIKVITDVEKMAAKCKIFSTRLTFHRH